MNCICVSTKYANLLDIIIPQNAKFFKKWYIVTHIDDKETIDIINKHNFPCIEVLFFDFYKNATFNKGGAIKYAQSFIKDGENVLLLDSDIFIPDKFSHFLDEIKENDIEYDVLYSFERYDFHTFSDFIKNENGIRYMSTFMGFFQLYKQRSHMLYRDSENCRVCDADFALFFPKQRMLEHTIIKHLGKDNVNHFGRTNNNDFLF
jgi:hypothetical protein